MKLSRRWNTALFGERLPIGIAFLLIVEFVLGLLLVFDRAVASPSLTLRR
jgi:hypothetical protein